MFQTATPLSPDLTQDERADAIREAYNEDRSQMTLMLAHKLRVPEVDILRALEGEQFIECRLEAGVGGIKSFDRHHVQSFFTAPAKASRIGASVSRFSFSAA